MGRYFANIYFNNPVTGQREFWEAVCSALLYRYNNSCSETWLHLTAIFLCVKVEGQGKSERTFIMVKPDGVQRGLVGEIVKRFEQKGFKLVALKFMKVRNSDSVFLTLFVPNQELLELFDAMLF